MSETTAEVRRGLRRAMYERDAHGVWFYGTWLFNRYYGTAIVVNVLTATGVAFAVRAFAL